MGEKRGHVLLQDVEIEQALIGACLVDNSLITTLAEHLRADDFHEPLHQQIVELIFEQEEASKAVTPLTLAAWLRHIPAFDDAGGVNYLSEMALAAPAMPSIKDLASIIAGHTARRRAIGALEDAQDAIYDNKPVAQALADVTLVADEVAARETEGIESVEAGRIAHTLLRDIERQGVSERAYACKTGIDKLDEIIGGLIPGNLVVIGGRPGMGKTIVGTEFCIAAAEQGWEPDFFSLEMPGVEISARMIASLSYDDAIRAGSKPIHYRRLVQFASDQHEVGHAARVNVEKLLPLSISVLDFDFITMARIAAIARARTQKAKRKGKRKIFVIDHLGLIEPDPRYRGRKVDELTLTTRQAKQLAKRTASPVVLLSQLNREVEGRDDKRPRIADFRDSGSIEQDADVLIGLYRDEYYANQRRREAKTKAQETNAESKSEPHTLEFIVLKARNSETGDPVKCHISAACGAIRNHAPVQQHAPTLMERISDPIDLAYADELNRGGR